MVLSYLCSGTVSVPLHRYDRTKQGVPQKGPSLTTKETCRQVKEIYTPLNWSWSIFPVTTGSFQFQTTFIPPQLKNYVQINLCSIAVTNFMLQSNKTEIYKLLCLGWHNYFSYFPEQIARTDSHCNSFLFLLEALGLISATNLSLNLLHTSIDKCECKIFSWWSSHILIKLLQIHCNKSNTRNSRTP